MAEALEDAKFWLPPQFLSDYDKQNVRKSRYELPLSFPYEFEPFGPNSSLDSPVESVLSSNETESSDEEDFLASLTQRLSHSTLRDSRRLAVPGFTHNKSEAKVAMARSPESTLSGFGSWSGWSAVSSEGSPNGPSQAPSPPTTPFGAQNNTWDLIYAAAGQVARLKMAGDGLTGPRQSSNLVSSMNNPRTGFYSPASQFQCGTQDPIFKPEWSSPWRRQLKVDSQPQNQQIQRRVGDFSHENGRFGRPLDLPQSAWPSLQAHRQSAPPKPSPPAMPPALHGGGSAPKRKCAGTGVFLPRRYDNPPQSRKRAGKAVNCRNPSFEDLNRSVPETTSNRRLAPSYDALIAQRNAMIAQQRLNFQRPVEGAKTHELLLPQEWTY